jgi:murein DD-endopeptidase MepM/ murein hydrolase activator NlpD
MKENLLILLILWFQLKTYPAYTQIITISQTGRKIISPTKPGDQIMVDSFSNEIPKTKEQMDGWQLVQPPNYMDFDKHSNVHLTKIVSTPLTGKLYITSGFAERFHPVLQKEFLNANIDLRADYEIVHSIANGIIVKEDYDPRAGNYLVIEHGDGIESMYCHLSKFLCKPGDVVSAGEDGGISESTGVVTGPHLHFAIKENGKFIQPLPLLRAIIRYNKITM